MIVLAVAAAVAAAVFTVLVKERTKSATIELPSDLHAVHTAEYARALLRGLEKTMRTGGRARALTPTSASTLVLRLCLDTWRTQRLHYPLALRNYRLALTICQSVHAFDLLQHVDERFSLC